MKAVKHLSGDVSEKPDQHQSLHPNTQICFECTTARRLTVDGIVKLCRLEMLYVFFS